MDELSGNQVITLLCWAMLPNDGTWRTTYQIQELWRQKGIIIDAQAVNRALTPLVGEGKVEGRVEKNIYNFVRHYWRKVGQE